MKKVVSNHQVAHLFANASQDYAQNAKRSFHFSRQTTANGKAVLVLFSYSTAIAFQEMREPNDSAPFHPIVMVDETYSPTTSKQQSLLRQAATHRTIVRLPAFQRYSYGYSPVDYRFSLDAKELKKSLVLYFSERQMLISENKRPLPRRSAGLACKLETYSRAYQILHGKPLGIELNEKLAEVAKKAARKAVREAVREQKKREAYALECARVEAEKLPAWRAGESVRLPYGAPETYLRIKGDVVETSRGAEVPLKLAVAFYKRLSAGTACAGMHVGAFGYSGLDAGMVTIGCHKIALKEMSDLYATLNAEVAA
jgi:hypothetical protein